MKQKIRLFILISICSILSGCQKDGQDGNNSLLDLIVEAPGDNCLNGGYKITSGIDLNSNNTLDENEIQNTEYICNGNNGGYDEQVRLSFGENYLFTSGTDWVISNNETEHLIKFNKSNYIGADSIVVAMRIATTDVNTKCYGELYNITDGVSIADTQLETTVSNLEPFEYIFSENIFNNLPDYEISLTIRIKSETNGVQVIGGFPSYIFIYRSNN